MAEEDLHQTVNILRSQVEILTSRLQILEKRLQEKAPDKMMAQPKVASNYDSKLRHSEEIKNSMKIPNTNTKLEIGGYIKLDVNYNSQSVGGSGGSNLGDQFLQPGSIPIQSNPSEQNQITFHARQSRFWIKSETPTDWGNFKTYLEMDFFAFQSPGNERVSNSYAPRLRHAYGTLGQFLIGQTYTTFMNVSALPELNDFGGPVGRIFARQPQIRWKHQLFNSSFNGMLALESPETTLTQTNGKRQTPNQDYIPDMIARINLHQSWGNISLAGMVRNIQTNTPKPDNAFGGVVNFSGKIKTIARDDLRFMGYYGNAMGRYASSNLFNGGAINNQGKISLFNQYGGYISYRHWWDKHWRSTLVYGISYADNPDFVARTVTRQAQAAQINLLWSPIHQATFGLEYTYANRKLENHQTGHLHRVQFSSIFHF